MDSTGGEAALTTGAAPHREEPPTAEGFENAHESGHGKGAAAEPIDIGTTPEANGLESPFSSESGTVLGDPNNTEFDSDSAHSLGGGGRLHPVSETPVVTAGSCREARGRRGKHHRGSSTSRVSRGGGGHGYGDGMVYKLDDCAMGSVGSGRGGDAFSAGPGTS
jgi:hypothetical protein